ncbi:DUF1294 domain-containing protein, partial [Geobacillus stearothermophilus]|uniref:DUF1294 domain-containing protein n=1 Tax=Geobacillus stearothermophilus TaxID=1422 RepID=UPI002E1A4F96|nr:DUF1294 domain-containing protein [Geobacillus stearothermophilus]
MVQYRIANTRLAIFIIGLDKQKAKPRTLPTAERSLWLLAFAGGAIRAEAGMYTFRHK